MQPKSLHPTLQNSPLSTKGNSQPVPHSRSRHKYLPSLYYYFGIETSHDSNLLLMNLNNDPTHTPHSVQAFDITGFYDNIPIQKAKQIIHDLIPCAFSY